MSDIKKNPMIVGVLTGVFVFIFMNIIGRNCMHLAMFAVPQGSLATPLNEAFLSIFSCIRIVCSPASQIFLFLGGAKLFGGTLQVGEFWRDYKIIIMGFLDLLFWVTLIVFLLKSRARKGMSFSPSLRQFKLLGIISVIVVFILLTAAFFIRNTNLRGRHFLPSDLGKAEGIEKIKELQQYFKDHPTTQKADAK